VPLFDIQAVECCVSVFREGLLTSIGHDVSLRVTELSFEVGDDDSISAEFDARSLRVREDVTGLSSSERREIERNAGKALDAARYPTMGFRSTKVLRDGASARIEGELTLRGVTKRLSVDARHDGEHWRAELRLDQREFGIKPYSAMFGALKIKPEVVVQIAVKHA
jgi:polyisoprenoid-binding protein YceI